MWQRDTQGKEAFIGAHQEPVLPIVVAKKKMRDCHTGHRRPGAGGLGLCTHFLVVLPPQAGRDMLPPAREPQRTQHYSEALVWSIRFRHRH